MIETERGNFRTLDDFDLKGKKVLVRVDFNSPLKDGKIEMNDRIREHALTLKEISEMGAAAVVLAHQGRPEKDFTESLEQHAKLAGEFIKIDYVDDLKGEEALKRIKSLDEGEILLLKNVRSDGEEFEPSPNNLMVRNLAPLFDIFVNDAFSVAHRSQTSTVSFAEVLPSCMGRLMEKELKAVKDMRSRRMLYVMGGAKPEDDLILVKDEKVEKVLSTGIFGLICLVASGYRLGKPEEGLDRGLVEEVKKVIGKIKVPLDVAVNDNGRKEIAVEDLPVDTDILDIGEKTMKFYGKHIKEAEAVFFKGPAGKFEERGFERGTFEIMKAIAESDCFSLIGGGHSSHAVELFNISKDKFSHVSLAGGALIAYLAGKELPGLEVLRVK
ncbi:MAG: phosphoglycerate kinase [archaeon]|nr:MAG: phosphoglycerate kinase [archaeon]